MSGSRVSWCLAISAGLLAAAVVGGCLPAPTANSSGQTASSAVPSAPASAKPSPSPRAFVKAIDAFVERVTSGKLSYHVAFDGSVRASVNLLPIVGSMDVSGKDFASSFTGIVPFDRKLIFTPSASSVKRMPILTFTMFIG